MTHLLDTDHISVLQRPGSREHAFLLTNLAVHPPTDVVMCVVGYHEQSLGCNNLISQARTDQALLRGYRLFFELIEEYRRYPLLEFDAPAIGLFNRLRSVKVRIGTMDLRIASIALAHDLPVVTANSSDFALVPGLRLENWIR